MNMMWTPGGATPLLVMDVFEHAFVLDYILTPAINAFMTIGWRSGKEINEVNKGFPRCNLESNANMGLIGGWWINA